MWKYLHSDAHSCGYQLSNKDPCLDCRILQPDGSLVGVWMTYDEVFNRCKNLAGQGEICVRDKSIITGYRKEPEKLLSPSKKMDGYALVTWASGPLLVVSD